MYSETLTRLNYLNILNCQCRDQTRLTQGFLINQTLRALRCT